MVVDEARAERVVLRAPIRMIESETTVHHQHQQARADVLVVQTCCIGSATIQMCGSATADAPSAGGGLRDTSGNGGLDVPGTVFQAARSTSFPIDHTRRTRVGDARE